LEGKTGSEVCMEEKFLTVDELCRYIKIAKPTVYKLLGKGRVPAAKVGRIWRFNKDSIDKWMAEKERYYMLKIGRRKTDKR